VIRRQVMAQQTSIDSVGYGSANLSWHSRHSHALAKPYPVDVMVEDGRIANENND